MKMAFLSFPSFKDPEAKAHTGEIITFVSYDYFKKWSKERWKNRGEDYEAVKQEIAERMLNFIEGKYPGFKEMVDFYELSTPLTTEHFTLHRNGEIYGMHTTPDRLLKDWNQVKTPIKNLYLTGTDAAVLGVAGAFTGGVFASVELMGKSLGLLHYIKLEGRAEAFAKELKSKGIRTVFGG
jgi:phytoene dehydrogenase-like protein